MSAIVGEVEYEQGIHAGDTETSVMLEILPDQVNMERAVREFPKVFEADSLLSLEGQIPVSWVMKDLSASGVVGDATVATAEKGKAILASVAAGWVEVFEEIYRFEGLRPKF